MSKKSVFKVQWWSPANYFSMEPLNYPEQIEFETSEEIAEICIAQGLRAKLFNSYGFQLGIMFEDGSYQGN